MHDWRRRRPRHRCRSRIRPPVAIWHSPLRRAAETAQAIHEAREADAPLRPLETLLEVSQGEWEGLTLEEVREHYPRQLQGWLDDPIHHHAPGGESLPTAFERAQRTMRTILALPAEGPPVGGRQRPDATGSSSTMPASRCWATRPAGVPDARPPGASWSPTTASCAALPLGLLGIGLEHFWSFPFALASISVLDTNAGVPRLRAHNLDEHITALGRR